jgi:tetratricopeptide (TPR) repeat protein
MLDWYLYEQEQYEEAQRFITTVLNILDNTDKTHQLLYANAITLRGLIELDMNKAQTALYSFLTALEIRERFLDPNDALIASCHNNISLAYTEIGGFEKAIEAGQKAINIRLRTDSDRIGN